MNKEFYPFQKFNGFFSFGLDYQKKRYILENRTWRSNQWDEISEIFRGDISANISYIEIPLKIGGTVKTKNQYMSNMYVGLSISIPIKNNSKIFNRFEIPLEFEERKTYDFDYVSLEENYIIPSNNVLFGVRFSYKQLAMTINYTRALSITDGITSLSMRDKIDTIEMSMAIMFNDKIFLKLLSTIASF